MIRDVSNAPYSDKNGGYGGLSGHKDGLVIDNANWLVKYPQTAKDLDRHEEMAYTTDPVSEYIASHIYGILGYPVHETMLVRRNGKIAVACKDFIDDSKERLFEIRTIKNHANGTLSELLERNFSSTNSSHTIEFKEILLHLQYNDILTKVEGIVERFYDMIVVDAFVNNADRNNGNWGVIRRVGERDTLAPVFDNGGAFNGKTPDSRLSRMLENPAAFESSVTSGVSIYGENRERYLVRELLQKDIPELKIAIVKNTSLIQERIGQIYTVIDEIPEEACSKVRKEFYKKSLGIRLEKLLMPIYEKSIEEVEKMLVTANNKGKIKG